MSPTPIDLKPFCCTTSDEVASRYDVTEPFVQDGYEYAVDGRIAVRRPTQQPNTVNRKLPIAKYVFGSHPDVANWRPIPERELDGVCGEGCQSGTCKCASCGQSVACVRCLGTGAEVAWIGALQVAIAYDEKVRSIPDVYISDEGDTLLFRSGDIEGVLMPLSSDGVRSNRREVAKQLTLTTSHGGE